MTTVSDEVLESSLRGWARVGIDRSETLLAMLEERRSRNFPHDQVLRAGLEHCRPEYRAVLEALGAEETAVPRPARQGWGWPGNSRKAHYFLGDDRSLCERWAYSGLLTDDHHDSPDNCAECQKKRAKLT